MTNRRMKAVSRAKRRAEGQGRRAKPRQPLGHRQSSPPVPSPQKTWRVREKPGEFEKTREFGSPGLGTWDWSLEQDRASSDHHSNIINHRSPKALPRSFLAPRSGSPLSAPLDTTGQFARALCPQRLSAFPTNQRPSGVPQRSIRARIVRANRVTALPVRRNQRTAKELRLTHGNGSGQNAKNPEPQSHLSAVSGVRPDNSRPFTPDLQPLAPEPSPPGPQPRMLDRWPRRIRKLRRMPTRTSG